MLGAFLTALAFALIISALVIASLIQAFREDERSFPQPQTDESGR